MRPARDDAPPGFEPVEASAFIAALGQLHHRTGTGVFGMRARPVHANTHGKVHGGFLASVVDVACSRTVRHELGDGAVRSTITMTLDYLNPAEVGSWIDVETALDRAGGRTAFTSARVLVGDVLVARASVILALSRPPA